MSQMENVAGFNAAAARRRSASLAWPNAAPVLAPAAPQPSLSLVPSAGFWLAAPSKVVPSPPRPDSAVLLAYRLLGSLDGYVASGALECLLVQPVVGAGRCYADSLRLLNTASHYPWGGGCCSALQAPCFSWPTIPGLQGLAGKRELYQWRMQKTCCLS